LAGNARAWNVDRLGIEDNRLVVQGLFVGLRVGTQAQKADGDEE